MVTKDLNAGYCCSHDLCCFSMTRIEGPEALVAIGYGVVIYQHRLLYDFHEGRSQGAHWVAQR